jgi:hypothetical protein
MSGWRRWWGLGFGGFVVRRELPGRVVVAEKRLMHLEQAGSKAAVRTTLTRDCRLPQAGFSD